MGIKKKKKLVLFSSVFSSYISHCSALTHMFSQACNMLHRSRSAPIHVSPVGWPDHLWQLRAFQTALSECVCVCVSLHCTRRVHPAQRRRDTQEPFLQYDKLLLWVRSLYLLAAWSSTAVWGWVRKLLIDCRITWNIYWTGAFQLFKEW